MFPEKRKRLHALDGLRGFCALSILFYHFNAWHGVDYFQIGYFCVYFFFLLSGFSMWYVYAARPLTIELLKSFFVSRFARIFPLYLSVVLIYALFSLLSPEGVHTLTLMNRIILNSTFLFGLVDPGKTSAVTGGWSIGIEWVFYLVFPLFLLFVRRMNVALILLVLCTLINQIYVGVLIVDRHFSPSDSAKLLDFWFAYSLFPTFLVYFVAGIATAHIYERLKGYSHRFSVLYVQCLSRLLVVGCVAFIFCYPSPNPDHFLLGYQFPFLVAAAMLAILSAALCVQPGVCEAKFYGFLGDISFSVYLIYYLVFTYIMPWFNFSDSETYALVSSTACTILLSYIIYRFYEMPARRWLVRVLS